MGIISFFFLVYMNENRIICKEYQNKVYERI